MVTFCNSLMWCAVTPAIIWVASRLPLERTRWPTRLMFVVVGLVLAIVIDLATSFVRTHLFYYGGPTPISPDMAAIARLRRLWFVNDFIVFVAVLAAGFARNYFWRYQVRREEAVRLQAQAAQLQAQLADARLSALRMQLNPHFLFNAMNSISSLMRTDVNAADTMLEQLSSLLRITLERGNVQLIPLREEMEFIEVYLSMQDQRYSGRVRRDISIDSELHDALVPAMILQPIVENAYAHGLSKLERGGELFIEAHRQSSHVNFVITNSGLGLQSVPNGSSNGHGVGLANVRSRLHLHYGDDCSFGISQIDSSHVTVAIGLPFQLSDKAEIGMTRYGAQ
jgi:sensor histidine kinase YesM